MFTVITFGAKIEIDEEEYKEIVVSMLANKNLYIRKETGEVIPLKPKPALILTQRLKDEEGRKLSYTGKWKCDWGTFHKFNENCECRNHKEKKKEKSFSIHPEVKRKLAGLIAGNKALTIGEGSKKLLESD